MITFRNPGASPYGTPLPMLYNTSSAHITGPLADELRRKQQMDFLNRTAVGGVTMFPALGTMAAGVRFDGDGGDWGGNAGPARISADPHDYVPTNVAPGAATMGRIGMSNYPKMGVPPSRSGKNSWDPNANNYGADEGGHSWDERRMAHGGTTGPGAILTGDPQADGKPNPEIVISSAPMRVIPLRDLRKVPAYLRRFAYGTEELPRGLVRVPQRDGGPPVLELTDAATGGHGRGWSTGGDVYAKAPREGEIRTGEYGDRWVWENGRSRMIDAGSWNGGMVPKPAPAYVQQAQRVNTEAQPASPSPGPEAPTVGLTDIGVQWPEPAAAAVRSIESAPVDVFAPGSSATRLPPLPGRAPSYIETMPAAPADAGAAPADAAAQPAANAAPVQLPRAGMPAAPEDPLQKFRDDPVLSAHINRAQREFLRSPRGGLFMLGQDLDRATAAAAAQGAAARFNATQARHEAQMQQSDAHFQAQRADAQRRGDATRLHQLEIEHQKDLETRRKTDVELGKLKSALTLGDHYVAQGIMTQAEWNSISGMQDPVALHKELDRRAKQYQEANPQRELFVDPSTGKHMVQGRNIQSTEVKGTEDLTAKEAANLLAEARKHRAAILANPLGDKNTTEIDEEIAHLRRIAYPQFETGTGGNGGKGGAPRPNTNAALDATLDALRPKR